MRFLAITTLSLAALLLAAGAVAAQVGAPPAAGPPSDSPGLTGTAWKLVELFGKPVAAVGEESPHLILKEAERRVEGFGGCNRFSGSYELQEGGRIKFAGVAATMRACPDMEVEAELFRALGMADGYAVGEGRLSLHKARTAPLARFEAATAP